VPKKISKIDPAVKIGPPGRLSRSKKESGARIQEPGDRNPALDRPQGLLAPGFWILTPISEAALLGLRPIARSPIRCIDPGGAS
jgi:hypothetical protein